VISRTRLGTLIAAVALALIGVAGLAQQAIRQPANHPQAEIARSAVSRLDAGESPDAVIPAAKVDIARSTDPFVIVVDGQRTVLASSATLDGHVVLPPPGVFDYVRSHGEDQITWQPAAGVRSWIVVDAFRGGFVVAGRSPADGEATGYLLMFWGSLAALVLAGVSAVGLFLLRWKPQ
jgi:hypothetical protein